MTTTNSLLIASKFAGQAGSFGGNSWTPLSGETDNTTTEANIPGKALAAFTLKFLGFNVISNNAQAGTNISRNNGSNGNQSISVGVSATGWFSDTTHSDSIASGSTFNMQRGNTGGFGQTITSVVSCAANTSPYSYQGLYRSGTNIGFSTTKMYTYPWGTNFLVSTESQVQLLTRAPGTWQALVVQVGSASSGSITFKSRINAANGNQTITIASGTGIFQDTTHTDAVASGDNLSISFISLNSSGSWRWAGSEFLGTTSAHENGDATPNGIGGVNLAASTTYNHQYNGEITGTNPTEAAVQLQIPYSLTLSKFRMNFSANTASLATGNTRKNTANGNGTISVTSGTAGFYEDTTHSDSYVATDLLSAQLTTSSTFTTLAIKGVWGLFDDGSVGSTVAYTLTSVQGSYAVSGKSAILTRGPRITAAQGTYTLTGQAAASVRHLSVPAVRGLYTLTGEAAGLDKFQRMLVTAGFYHLTGFDVLGGRRFTLNAHKGRYRLHKQKTILRVGNTEVIIWPVDSGDYTLTGIDAILGHSQYRLTFAEFNNTDYVDWATLAGADFESFLNASYLIPGDPMTFINVPYVYVFVDDNDEEDISLILNVVKNWAETGNVPEIGTPIQVYRHRDGYILSVTKNRIRGRGRVHQLQFHSESGKAFNLRGWAGWLEKNVSV